MFFSVPFAFIPNWFLNLSSFMTTVFGKATPIPHSTNNAHFHRKGLMTMTKMNQYNSSAVGGVVS
jgi:hypothetical protein